MTIEEALKRLKVLSCHVDLEDASALDMAIEALSADTVSHEEYEKVLIECGEVKTRLGEIEAEMVVVRCKDCRWQEECSQFVVLHKFCGVYQEISFCSHGERAEQTEYKMPGHDEVMEALDKLTLRGGKDV